MKFVAVLITGIAVLAVSIQAETIQVLRNQSDIPLLNRTVAGCSVPERGRASVQGGSLLYTPEKDFVGKEILRVAFSDGSERDVTIDVRAYPNLVFILTDDQSWTGLGMRMDKNNPESASDLHRTPNIDRIGAAGMRFSRGYSPAPNCSPSRYANLTGKTTARLQFTDIVGRGHSVPPAGSYRLAPVSMATSGIEESETTIPELLKSLPNARYRAAHWGKWHLAGGGPERHGFDVSDGATGNREGSQEQNVEQDDPKLAYGIAQRAKGFISETVEAGRPFYCQISHYAVHASIQYRAETYAETRNWKPGVNHVSQEYAAMVADLDRSVGQVLDHLDALGLRHSTYLVYQADNGAPQFMSNAIPLRRYKPEIWEGGTRVPTLFSGPGIPENSQCDQAMMGVDLLPTLWELAGGDAARLPAAIDGASIAAWLKGDTNTAIQRPGALVVHSPHYIVSEGGITDSKNQRPSSAIHEGPWKLVAWYETGAIHLYNVEEDIGETRDLAAERPAVTLRLWKRLRDYLGEVEAQFPSLDAAHESNPGGMGDADEDGLADDWELSQLLTHALGPDDDPDGDGRSNATEYKAKTDPLAAN